MEANSFIDLATKLVSSKLLCLLKFPNLLSISFNAKVLVLKFLARFSPSSVPSLIESEIPSPNICIEVILNFLECASVKVAHTIINKIKDRAHVIIEPIVSLLKISLFVSISKKAEFNPNPKAKPKIDVVWNIVK